MTTPITNLDPWADPLGSNDVAVLLQDIRDFLRRFIFLREPEYYDVLACWCVLTGVLRRFDAADVAPRIGFLSGQPGSGKSTALTVLAAVTGGRGSSGITGPALLRMMNPDDDPDAPHPMFIDEIDNIYSAKATDTCFITAVLNDGYRRSDARVIRAHSEDQSKVVEYDAFGPVAFAGLAKAVLPDALLSRTFVIEMPLALPGERPERWISRRHQPMAAELSARIRELPQTETDVEQAIDHAIDELFPGKSNRDLELWSAVGAVAVLAGEDWPDRLVAAAMVADDALADRDEPHGVRLLRLARDLRDSGHSTHPMNDRAVSREALRSYANEHDDAFAQWDRGEGMTHLTLRNLLKENGVNAPRVVKIGGATHRGWYWSDFEDAWARHLGVTGPTAGVTEKA